MFECVEIVLCDEVTDLVQRRLPTYNGSRKKLLVLATNSTVTNRWVVYINAKSQQWSDKNSTAQNRTNITAQHRAE